MVLAVLLRQMIRYEPLDLIEADGRVHHLGPHTDAPPIAMRLNDARVGAYIARDPLLHFGEAWMDGRFSVENGTLYDLVALFMRNIDTAHAHWFVRLTRAPRRLLKRVAQTNPIRRAQRNVAHHYDLTDELYRIFLDDDRNYSCAYFADAGASLEDAQRAKQRHIAAKMLLAPGQRVLDIGSGWGGMALYLGRVAGCDVTGITLSVEQHGRASARASAAGLDERVRFRLQDYRTVAERFDRIVSIGMFEHVGITHYDTYFQTVRDLLEDDGVAVIHAIGRSDGPGVTNPWIAKYIFPGGYCPALSEVLPAVERAGLVVTDVEILRLHYAETLKAWRERFMARRDEAVALYDERFARMWELYLAGSETAFRHGGQMVFQIQLARRVDTVPLTRDYIAAAEQRLALAEKALAAEAPAQPVPLTGRTPA
jgi:cyclopropane-fatty-acyl-phospholipid synthase